VETDHIPPRLEDHVYVSSPFEHRECNPYGIARIMEFIAPDVDTGRSKGKEPTMRARVAWYYRAGDLNERQVIDSRLLLAAIYTEVVPVTNLRGICHVRHKDKILDLSAWRKRPDCFYFYRLFDPYVKKEFELLRTQEIRNRKFAATESHYHPNAPLFQFLRTSRLYFGHGTNMC
jgi:hypothetical protein